MDAPDLIDLGDQLHKRAQRAIAIATSCAGEPCGDDDVHAELCRKLIADELQSEWLRAHSSRRPKRGELQLLVRMYGQLTAAVQLAIERVEPAAMPAAARGAVVAFASPVRRR